MKRRRARYTHEGSRTLLVNHWFYDSVGHTVEALRTCLGYHKADASLRISLLLRNGAATELADVCPFIEKTYDVSARAEDFVGEVPAGLVAVPREWDWVVDRVGSHNKHQLETFPDIRLFYEAAGRHLRPRLGRGITGQEPPRYERHHQLRLNLPSSSRAKAARELAHAPIRIAVVLAGSSDGRAVFPSVSSWQLMLRTLASTYPDAVFCLIGKLRKDGRSYSEITREEVDAIAAVCPDVIDAFERPLLDQLAFVEACHLLLSPHTGFGFGALAVGTPWLILSGGYWYERFFNGVPFYSVIPDRDRYPCYPGWLTTPLPTIVNDEGEGTRTPSMSKRRIKEDLPELVKGAGLLIEGRLSYEEALQRHFKRLLDVFHGDKSRISSFDDLHLQFV